LNHITSKLFQSHTLSSSAHHPLRQEKQAGTPVYAFLLSICQGDLSHTSQPDPDQHHMHSNFCSTPKATCFITNTVSPEMLKNKSKY